MDPQATWTQMLCAVSQREWDEAQEFAEALLEWMRKGGVPPQTVNANMRHQWNRAMAEFGCLLALQFVRDARARKDRSK